MKIQTNLFFLLGLSLGLNGQNMHFPEAGSEWEMQSPIKAGIDTENLQKAVDFAKANEYSGSRDLRQAILNGFESEPFHSIQGPTRKRGGPAGMIFKNGYLVTSWGDTQRVDMTFSVTKSFLSTVAGLAVGEGIIASVNDSVARYVWDGTFDGAHNAGINWKHLLQQNSDWSGALWGAGDWADRPPEEGGLDDWRYRKLNTPGTVFEYNDVRVNVLAYALTQVWRKPLPMVLKEKIMDPIGASTTWRWLGYEDAFTVIDGLNMQSVTGGGHSGGGMFISTADMARFGMLFLNNGKWKEEQLMAEGWIKEAMQPSEPNVNYGYMWWLNKQGPRHWKGVSEDIYYAAGFGGNFIVVDKAHDLITVVRWLEPSKMEAFMQLLSKAL